MILVTVLVTQKFYNDHYFGNNSIAHLGGGSLKELNMLEEEFLEIINFDVNVTTEEFN